MRTIRKIPKTVAEYAAEMTEARNEGASNALEIVLYVMLDKYGWDTDQLTELMHRVGEQAQLVTEGYMTPADIRRVLRDEYFVEV